MKSPGDLHGLVWPSGEPDLMALWAKDVAALAAQIEALSSPPLTGTWTGEASNDMRLLAHAAAAQARQRARHLESLVGPVLRLSGALRSTQETVTTVCRRLDDLAERAANDRRLSTQAIDPGEAAARLHRAQVSEDRYLVARRRHEGRIGPMIDEVDVLDRAVAGLLEHSSESVPIGFSQLTDRPEDPYAQSREDLRHHIKAVLEPKIRRLLLIGLMIPSRMVVVAVAVTLLLHQRDMLRAWLQTDRQFWDVSFDGDGRVVEVLGDLTTARSVIVVVPGVGNSIWTHDQRLGPAIRSLYDRGEGELAVVAWLGYDAPGSAPLGSMPFDGAALGVETASRGAGALAMFIDTLLSSTRPGTTLTVIGHSYGSLVAALGVARSSRIDDLILLGSPGIPVPAGNLNAQRVWASTMVGDPIDEIAALTVAPGVPDDDCQVPRLHHGWNPVHDDFGAREIDLPGRGHGGYFGAGPAGVLVSIARGDYGSVPRVGRHCAGSGPGKARRAERSNS